MCYKMRLLPVRKVSKLCELYLSQIADGHDSGLYVQLSKSGVRATSRQIWHPGSNEEGKACFTQRIAVSVIDALEQI